MTLVLKYDSKSRDVIHAGNTEIAVFLFIAQYTSTLSTELAQALQVHFGYIADFDITSCSCGNEKMHHYARFVEDRRIDHNGAFHALYLIK